MLDDDRPLDLDTVLRNIDEAEVVSLYFPHLRKTLLIDTRCDPTTGPLVRVVDMTSSGQARLRSLRRMRPQFPRPDSITLIPWTGRTVSLQQLGVWSRILDRLVAVAGRDAPCLDSAALCLEQLAAYQRREFKRAITGQQYHTLWGRLGVSDNI